jgi:hypothetical protein
MDDAERKALIRSMSAGWFAMGSLYNDFQRARRNPDYRKQPDTLWFGVGVSRVDSDVKK